MQQGQFTGARLERRKLEGRTRKRRKLRRRPAVCRRETHRMDAHSK